MSLIINLSSLHKYSISETVYQFVKMSNEYSQGYLSCAPFFVQNTFNYAWVMLKYNEHYKVFIEPYKLGRLSTDTFLDNLAAVFNFLSELPREKRHDILASAWNSSISLDDEMIKRLSIIIEASKTQSVFLVSNTNELNMAAILKLFLHAFKEKCMESLDISIKDSQEPVEIMPNIFLCLSYRYCAFKDGYHSTASLIDLVSQSLKDNVTVVSQFQPDLDKAKELGLGCVEAGSFYSLSMPRESLSL